MAAPRYALVGDGRLASSIGPYLEQSGAPVRQWSRRINAAGAATLAASVADADTVLLAISDGAIASFANQHADMLAGKTLVHFSGALVIEGMAGAHPLFSFPPSAVGPGVMESVTFVTERGGKTFGDLFPTLKNPSLALSPDQKPLYHALAVLSGNLVSFTWNEVARVMHEKLDLPPSQLLAPYFRSLIDGFETSPLDSLTGPVARGDQATIEKNLASLHDEPVLDTLYKALLDAAARKGLLT